MHSGLRSEAPSATRLKTFHPLRAKEDQTISGIRARLGRMREFPLIRQGGFENLVDIRGDARLRLTILSTFSRTARRLRRSSSGFSPPAIFTSHSFTRANEPSSSAGSWTRSAGDRINIGWGIQRTSRNPQCDSLAQHFAF